MKIKLGSREDVWQKLAGLHWLGAPEILLAKPIKFNLHCYFSPLSLTDFLLFLLGQVASTSFPVSFMLSHNPLPKRSAVFTSYLPTKAGEDLPLDSIPPHILRGCHLMWDSPRDLELNHRVSSSSFTIQSKKKKNQLTQSSGPQIRNQIQPRLEKTPLGESWGKADQCKVFLELLCCFKHDRVFISHFCYFLSIFIRSWLFLWISCSLSLGTWSIYSS